ncbi:hypothetical protein V6N13_132966 [Hibiscus sabdariffa]|uniref:DEAD/DEAH-box helicase domain-containing protein n=1 Tax=Hibiscus sabdariffa TaxID=183260 RepID=A0ABR2PWW2_9ROSI
MARASFFQLTQALGKLHPFSFLLFLFVQNFAKTTTELGIQVEDQAKVLGKGLIFKTALVVGGDPIARQLYCVPQGVELIIGRPGRLIDLLTKQDIELNHVKIFGLVDCMLQRGFRDQVMQIFRALSTSVTDVFCNNFTRRGENSKLYGNRYFYCFYWQAKQAWL